MQIFRTLSLDAKGSINPRVEATRIFIAASGLPERL
jgi:hypothetical protein